MNFLSLAGKSYADSARGILYVIYEVIWKLTYYVLTLIDEIAKLFYKVAGINVSDGVVEKASIIDQLLGQKAITIAYAILLIFALGLILVFSLVMVIKNMTSDTPKSLGPLFKNMALAFLLLAVMGPVVLFAISMVSNVAVWIAGLGGNESISIADVVFSNSGNLLDVYNEVNGTAHTSFRDLGNGFLYDLMYPETVAEGATPLAYHWYISLLGGAFVLYNLGYIVFDLVKRLFNIVILYVASPFSISKMVLDDGKSFKEWQGKLVQEFILLLTQISTFMIFVALINVINNIDLDSLAAGGEVEDTGGLGDIYEPIPGETPEEEVATVTFSLLNGVGRTLIIMAAVSVTRSSAKMLTEVLKGKETKTDTLLENVLNKISTRSTQPTRTRTITKNTTTTKRETVFVESQSPGGAQSGLSSVGGSSNSFAGNSSGPTNVTNHVTQNVNISNKFNSTNNITNRSAREGITKGSYSGERVSPGVVYINASKSTTPTPTTTSEWKMMDQTATKVANNMIKDYKSASSNFSVALSSNDSAKIQKSFADYASAYKKEAEILADNYKKFEQKATTSMTSEISKQTKEELKNISASYRKAQLDYAKTANKLQKMNGERMSTSEALKLKEQADKQRERLMSASNKAAHFYENQKKGE